MGDVVLFVNGRAYGGWKSIRVVRSIERLAGSFDLVASDRWGGQNEPWAIGEEDECRIEIDGELVLTGFVDGRSIALSGSQRELSFRGKASAAALEECDALLDKWSFKNASVLDICRKLAAPFGISVSLQPGLALGKPPRRIVVHPGETAWNTIEAAARAAGVLVVSDDRGGIVLTRAGRVRTHSQLVEEENLLGITVDYDGTERFARYILLTQIAGTEEAPGQATRIKAEATDEGVRRTERVKVIRPEHGMTKDFAKRRADWEARVRAAKAQVVQCVVRGWTQENLELWPINQLVTVRSPSVGVDGTLLIVSVEYTLSEGGETTQLRLMRPDAITPEPKAVVKKSGEIWKELAGGAR